MSEVTLKEHEKYMRMALALAKKARGQTRPNPMVGAVVVKNGRVVGQGYHQRAGLPHAEALALQEASGTTRGATLYVSLEPCCHTDKKTPPCTEEIIRRGIKRVVVAMRDPNPKVAGKGLSRLLRAGIEVTEGIARKEAERLNEAYAKHITTGLPFVTLKLAMSLDGKIATSTGESKWISGERARQWIHSLRSEVDAVMVGVGTVRADDPLLTTHGRGRNPVRVIVDSRLSLPLSAQVLSTEGGSRTIVATTPSAQKEKIRKLEAKGVHVITLPDKAGLVDLPALMAWLGKEGVMSLLIEGGATIASSAVREGLVDKVLFIVAPLLIGGQDAKSVIGGRSPESLKDAIRLKDIRVRRIGEDLVIEGHVR